MQRDRRGKGAGVGAGAGTRAGARTVQKAVPPQVTQLVSIGYVIYQLKGNEGETPLGVDFFKRNGSFARCTSFVNSRGTSLYYYITICI